MSRSASEIITATSALTARERTLIARDVMPGDTEAQLLALREAVAALDAAQVPHALIGGIAVGVRAGTPRGTQDVDLATGGSVPRSKVVEALVGAGFTHRGSYPHSENFRHRSGEPLQVAFDAAFEGPVNRAEALPVGKGLIRVVLLEDLITLKERAAADPKRRRSKALRDLADVALLRGDAARDDEGW